MRAIIESQSYRLGREVIAKDLAIARAARAFLGLLRERIGHLAKNLFAIGYPFQKAHVRVPLFPPAGLPARGELRKNAGYLFAMGKLDRLQVIMQATQRRG